MAYKISIVIPNYNGAQLLSKNLPEVLEKFPNCEIIVVDDASTDDSINLLKNNFKKIKVIKHSENVGFAKSVNDGVSAADGSLVILLNTDVVPKGYYLNKITKYFNDPQIFAVGFADFSHEDDLIVKRGKGLANFREGFVHHFAAKPTSGETMWVSGGSGVFDKKKFQLLGGFDQVYAPFYWEDIDLSFRAWCSGLVCLFDSTVQVDHFHKEGAIQKTKSSFLVKSVSYKNQFLFVWKNISNTLWLIEHIIWLPYHFVRAIITFDVAFYVGFFWALIKIPSLILNYQQQTSDYQLTDREVIAKFEKE